ncbi:MAG: AAA family ATPase [archaeon]|nr:AAA family ATPase [archaeon]
MSSDKLNPQYPKTLQNLLRITNPNINPETIKQNDFEDTMDHLKIQSEAEWDLQKRMKGVMVKKILNAPYPKIKGPPLNFKSQIEPDTLFNVIPFGVFQNVPSTGNLFSNYQNKMQNFLGNQPKNNLNIGKKNQQNKIYKPKTNQQMHIPSFNDLPSGGYMESNNIYKKKNQSYQNECDEGEDEEEEGNYNVYGIKINGKKKAKKNYGGYGKKKRKFGNYADEEDEDAYNEPPPENTGFQSAITLSNAVLKNKVSDRYVNKLNQKDDDDDRNQNIGNYQNQKNTKNAGKKYVPPRKLGEAPSKNTKLKDDDKTKVLDEKLKGFDERMIEFIESEILSTSPNVSWDDIAGLEFAKKTIKEIIIWPLLRPDIFNGIRRPPKGLLLFGPPGTGKTMIAKAIASQSHSHFFNISASSLMSKWVGESEKLVRTLFALASFYQPSVVFIDEIDSILTSRSENECESSRRIKTEFLVQLDGAGTNADDRILIIGATNLPQEIDDAFIRRLSKRLYIPLPNKASRKQLINNVLTKEQEKNNKYELSEGDIDEIVNLTKGYSGSDLINVCREAAMMPIRSIEDISKVQLDNLRGVNKEDFITSINHVKPSVSVKTIEQYVQWNKDFGSFQFEETDE